MRANSSLSLAKVDSVPLSGGWMMMPTLGERPDDIEQQVRLSTEDIGHPGQLYLVVIEFEPLRVLAKQTLAGIR